MFGLAGAVRIVHSSRHFSATSSLQEFNFYCERNSMTDFALKLWTDEAGQDIAEYAVMLAVILVLVVGTIRLVGSNANNVFSSAASSIQ
jgi:Flp pilus assembly pilin Flp